MRLQRDNEMLRAANIRLQLMMCTASDSRWVVVAASTNTLDRPHDREPRLRVGDALQRRCVQALVSSLWQARSQILRLGGKYILGGEDFCFYDMLKQIFLGTAEFGGNCPQCLDSGIL